MDVYFGHLATLQTSNAGEAHKLNAMKEIFRFIDEDETNPSPLLGAGLGTTIHDLLHTEKCPHLLTQCCSMIATLAIVEGKSMSSTLMERTVELVKLYPKSEPLLSAIQSIFYLWSVREENMQSSCTFYYERIMSCTVFCMSNFPDSAFIYTFGCATLWNIQAHQDDHLEELESILSAVKTGLLRHFLDGDAKRVGCKLLRTLLGESAARDVIAQIERRFDLSVENCSAAA